MMFEIDKALTMCVCVCDVRMNGNGVTWKWECPNRCVSPFAKVFVAALAVVELSKHFYFTISSGFNVPAHTTPYTAHKRVKPNPYMELTHFNAQIRITLEKLPQTRAHTHMVHVHHQTQAINFYELSDLPEIKMYERCVEEYCVCAYLLSVWTQQI